MLVDGDETQGERLLGLQSDGLRFKSERNGEFCLLSSEL